MKTQSILYFFIFILFNCCNGPIYVKDDYYQYSESKGTFDQDLIVEKSNRIKKLSVYNYTSIVFPNSTIEQLHNLKSLYLQLDSFPSEKKLDIRLEIDAEKLSKLKNLEELYIGTFSMEFFPKSIENKNLKKLSLFMKEVDRINSDLSKLKKLKYLYFGMKDLVEISDSTKFPASLREINIHSEKLNYVSSNSIRKSSIEKVSLNGVGLPDSNLIRIINKLSSIETLKKITVSVYSCERRNYIMSKIDNFENLNITFYTECLEELID